MLALGRHHRWPPAYWRNLDWHELSLYIAHRNEELSADRAREREREGTRIPLGPLAPPAAEELAQIPWAGEGDDPLEELFGL